ncbi:hypothetical protein HCN44_006165 [Aphidius gifuensis]|uniref:RNA helicase n=1 Tax=Aphidius gifuensis TaxID=684658 RepID=A0A835CVT5_APHGI|nr:uncharacterized protein LOC122852941 [Aphidius gifuensis]KAF7997594.1 hypothetical protein HCN44_006165 [Aphidius gifuensis]
MDMPSLKNSNVITPNVVWYQNDDRVVLRVMLIDVDDYFLAVDYNQLRFSTINNNKNYYLILNLFGAVIPEKTFHKNLGRELRIELPKAHRFLKWSRLVLNREKIPQISMDLDKVEIEQWKLKKPTIKHEWTDWNEYKRINNLNIMPDVPSSDGESSDDERFNLIED